MPLRSQTVELINERASFCRKRSIVCFCSFPDWPNGFRISVDLLLSAISFGVQLVFAVLYYKCTLYDVQNKISKRKFQFANIFIETKLFFLNDLMHIRS